MTEIRTSVNEERLSSFKVILDVEGDAPDVQNPNLPDSPVISPKMLVILAYPAEGDRWELSLINVVGPRRYEATGRLTKRYYDVAFVDPCNPDSKTPGWLLDIAMKHQNRLNGALPGFHFHYPDGVHGLVCERCDTNVTRPTPQTDGGVYLETLVRFAEEHACTPERLAEMAAFNAQHEASSGD